VHFNPQAVQGGQAGQPRNWQGQGGQHVYGQAPQGQGQGGQPGAQRWQGQQNWQGRGPGQPNNQVQRWNGQGGQAWQGQRGGGFGWQNHGLRGRDEGRTYYSAGAFQRQYRSERRFRFGGYRSFPSGWYFRSWNYGDVLPYGWFASQYYLDWADYGLPPPPIGCEWVAQGPDAVLVDVWTGEVLSVVSGVFYWNGY
jgi:Ni/Co efflux regulator RcnB